MAAPPAEKKVRKRPKTTLNAENLQSLGAPRLAELLLDFTADDGARKRQLQLELAALASPQAVARKARSRLGAIAKATSRISWGKAPAAFRELKAHYRAITRGVAEAKPDLALELLFLLVEALAAVVERSSINLGGELQEDAAERIGELAAKQQPDPGWLAERVFGVLQRSNHRKDPLFPQVAEALGAEGFDHLKRRLAEGGPARWNATATLLRIADIQGDVDEFIRLHSPEERRKPQGAAAIASRLVAANRAEEALGALDAVTEGRYELDRHAKPPLAWADARIAALEALGRGTEAHEVRWECFDRRLSVPHLRDWLRQYPTFDAMDAEERAFGRAEDRHPAAALLEFYLKWPDLKRASAVVVRRVTELDGQRYWNLEPAGEALAARFPLAATLVFRKAVESRLAEARETRDRAEIRRNRKAAARRLGECAALTAEITDFGAHPNHGAYVSRLRQKHAYSYEFWDEVRKQRPG